MASCNLGGGLNLKVLSSYPNFNKARCSGKEVERNQWRSYVFHGATLVHLRKTSSTRFTKQHFDPNPFVVSCSSSQIKGQPEYVFEERKTNSARSQMISSSQVQSLLTNICDTTTIAEFKLNLGGFHIYMKRNLDGDGLENLPPTLPPIYVDTPAHFPNSNGSATSTSLTITKSANSTEEIQSFSVADSDDGLVMLPSPKVGFFRRSRTIKGKRAPPSCKEKQEVKEGQVICYIEQLGGEIPIESDVSGEVVKILKKDGEPVGYGDALIAILPSFPGIKKLQLSA